MIIKNAKVFTPDGVFVEGSLKFGEVIEAVLPGDCGEQAGAGMEGSTGSQDPVDRAASVASADPDAEGAIDAQGCYLIPGLIDVHTHGAVGEDASDGRCEGIFKMAEFYAKHGTTSWCPTTMTLKEPALLPAMRAIREYAEHRPENSARCAGVHLEGPFLSYERRGAQNPDNLMRPDFEMVRRLDETSGGLVKLITVAPEIEGAAEFIAEASKYYNVSEGHTCADYDTACEGFRLGARHVTHLFNGMNPMLSRAPGVLVAALESGAAVELIVDGLHIHPAVVRMIYELFPGRVNMISDSLRCTGMPDGDYDLGGQPITLRSGKATLKDSDTLAGSTITMLDGLRNVVRFGVPVEEAVWSATAVPAMELGAGERIGFLKEGAYADFLLLDEQLELKAVYIGGRKVDLR